MDDMQLSGGITFIIERLGSVRRGRGGRWSQGREAFSLSP